MTRSPASSHINRDHLPYSLSFPFTPAIYLFITDSLHTRRLPPHLQTTCPSSSHVFTASDQITLINPKLASLPSSAPDLKQRAGRPVSFAKPVHCDSRSSPGRRRPNLAARLARAPNYVLPASRPRVPINTADLPTQIIADLPTQIITDDAPMRLAHGARSCVQPPLLTPDS